MSKLRILLVDDHEVVRIGLRTLLSRHPDFEVVGEASSGSEAVADCRRLMPNIVLMDIRLPGGSGIEACRQVLQVCPGCKVIMLTSYGEDELLFEAIAAGASGYVLKQVGSEALIASIEAVARGESPLDPSLTGRLFARVRDSVQRDRQNAFVGLTPHEMKVLSQLTTGKSNKEIGNALGLGEKTVRNYVSSILSKLGLSSRAEAAAFAVAHRIGDLVE